MDPLSILRESIKAVPALKYALGVAGIASVIVIIRVFKLDYGVALVGTIIMLLLMTSLVVFARLSSLASPDMRVPALVFTWFSLLFVIVIAITMFSSVLFGWPKDIKYIVSALSGSSSSSSSSSGTPKLLIRSSVQSVTPVMESLRARPRPVIDPPILNSESDCPEIAYADYTKYPVEFRKERRCSSSQ